MEPARRQGLLVGKGGLYGNVIRISTPMNVSKKGVDESLTWMGNALSNRGEPAS